MFTTGDYIVKTAEQSRVSRSTFWWMMPQVCGRVSRAGWWKRDAACFTSIGGTQSLSFRFVVHWVEFLYMVIFFFLLFLFFFGLFPWGILPHQHQHFSSLPDRDGLTQPGIRYCLTGLSGSSHTHKCSLCKKHNMFVLSFPVCRTPLRRAAAPPLPPWQMPRQDTLTLTVDFTSHVWIPGLHTTPPPARVCTLNIKHLLFSVTPVVWLVHLGPDSV